MIDLKYLFGRIRKVYLEGFRKTYLGGLERFIWKD